MSAPNPASYDLYGFPQWLDAQCPIVDSATRLLVGAPGAHAIEIAGGVLHVVADHVPTPAEVARWEAEAGLPVTCSVAPRDVFDSLSYRIDALTAPGAPTLASAALADAAAAGASDVLLVAGDVPRMRTLGKFTTVGSYPALSVGDVHEATRWLIGGPGDAAPFAGSRWRGGTFVAAGRPALAAHRLVGDVPRLEDLGLPAQVAELTHAQSGLVIIAGPPGSGKSTTVAALVGRINQTRSCHIATVETGIEFRHQARMSAVTQHSVGPSSSDGPSIGFGVRCACRYGADVIATGVLDSAEDVGAALSAAESGRLVIMPVDATGATAAVANIVARVAGSEQPAARARVARVLTAVAAQFLVPSASGDGMLPVCEILLATPQISAMIAQGRDAEIPAAVGSLAGDGMISLERSLALHVAAGQIDTATALRFAPSKERFEVAAAAIHTAQALGGQDLKAAPRTRHHRGK